MDLKTFFERVYCVTLMSRNDRRDALERNFAEVGWPFADVVFVEGVNGKATGHPAWWKGPGPGAWGCYRSHLRLIEQCLSDGTETVLLLEDDAFIRPGFTEKAAAFLAEVPADWECIYLGGEHLYELRGTPTNITDRVQRPFNVNRTHAWALNRAGMRKVYRYLCDQSGWTGNIHIDHRLGTLHEKKQLIVYSPSQWLVGQRKGFSDVQPRQKFPDRMWVDGDKIADSDPTQEPFVAVLGLHSSGSSCLAGVLYHLGVHLGNKLTGYYGNDPQKSCGFEAQGLMALCEKAIPFPAVEYKQKKGQRWTALSGWINQRRREAVNMQTVAGGKYPQLCQFGDQLLSVVGDNLHVVFSDRPIEESIESMCRRFPKMEREKIAAHQQWLEDGKKYIDSRVPEERKIRVDYSTLISQPQIEVDRIAAWLPIDVDADKIRRAVKYVDPKKRHVGAEVVAS